MTSAHPDAFQPVTLDNCDREPIHIPGAIQPHGALLAFDRLGRLSHASENAAAMLGISAQFGRPLKHTDLDAHPEVHQLIRDVIGLSATEEVLPQGVELQLNGRIYDVIVHSVNGTTVCEFEQREQDADELASFAQKAYRSMDILKRQRSIDKLLEAAVGTLREMTGFDRVMAYRFRHDDSGEVAAEARRDDLPAYLGRRYPASDIPVQARRLYILNTLRLIPDVGYEAVALLADAAQQEPLDLSHSVLRSVSPVHVEYLSNMGVGASMSVSIVVGGKLWGMLACHHMGPRRVPFSLRMAADVVAQLLASSVQSLLAQAREAAIARAAWLRTELVSQVVKGSDVLTVLSNESAALQEGLSGDALVVMIDGELHLHGDIDRPWAGRLEQWLSEQNQAVVHVSVCAELPAPPADHPEHLPLYCGLLALRFDTRRNGWLVALRQEQIQTIRWGGKPEKVFTHGPLGPRLTPRGSFDEWRETVRGTSEPWSETQLEIASQLLASISRAHADHIQQLDQIRSQLWAVLGHDLRNPLQSLSMASRVLDQQGGDASNRMRSVIKNSAGRMQDLLRDVLDISRVQNGFGLNVQLKQTDLVPLLNQLKEEAEVAHSQQVIQGAWPERLLAEVDASRIAQVVSNLLSNARQHGHDGRTALAASSDGHRAVITVTNAGDPIPPEVLATLFDPFKRQSLISERNRTGMGLGLYIADQIVRAHHGSIGCVCADGQVTFTVSLPVHGDIAA